MLHNKLIQSLTTVTPIVFYLLHNISREESNLYELKHILEETKDILQEEKILDKEDCN